MTVGELVHEAARGLDRSGSDTPRLDAEVLLGHVLGVDRATLLAAPEALVGEGAAETFRTLVERRSDGRAGGLHPWSEGVLRPRLRSGLRGH